MNNTGEVASLDKQFLLKLEIVKCGFWRKLPPFYHFCYALMQIMKIRDFSIYSFTNDLLPSGLYNLVFMKNPNWQSPAQRSTPKHPIGYFIIPTTYYNVRNLLYDPNFSLSLILVIRSSLRARYVHIVISEIVIFGLSNFA